MNVDVFGKPRRRGMYLSEIQFATAVTLIEEGHSRRQVALILNVNRGTTNRAWIRYQIHGIVRR
jgi:transposase-like protein